MTIKNNKFVCVFIAVILLLSLCSAVYADEESGSISHIVVQINEDLVLFTVEAYEDALTAGEGNEVYDYMADGGIPFVRAIRSGDKFISIGVYGLAFADVEEIAGALASASAQDEDTIKGYLIFKGFDGENKPILTPLFPAVSFEVTGGNGTLSAKVGDTGINSGAEVAEGSDVVFTAAPAQDYRVKEWKKDGAVVDGVTDNTYTISDIEDDVNVTVEFEEIPAAQYTVTYGVTGGNGTLSAKVGDTGINSGAEVAEGSDVVFTAAPAQDYRVKEWKKDGAVVDGVTDNTYTISDIEDDVNVTVEFEKIPAAQYTVAYGVIGGNGTLSAKVGDTGINSGAEAAEGSDVVFTAAPAQDYRVKEWKKDGAVVGGVTDNTYTISDIEDDVSVTVEFEKIPTVISASVSELYRVSAVVDYDGSARYGVRKLADGVYNVELDMSKVIAKFGDISGFRLQLIIGNKVVKGEDETNVIDSFVIKSDYAVLPAVQQRIQTEAITINPATLAEAIVSLTPIDPASAPVSELYKEGLDVYYNGILCYGVRQVVSGVYNVELDMSKVTTKFGDISGRGLQLRIDGKAVKGQDKNENITDLFSFESGAVFLPAIQQGRQTEAITINPATLAGATVFLI